MKNKILFTFLSLALVFGAVGFAGVQTASAQAFPSFSAGCTSNWGYSVINGNPCNGTSSATMSLPGCATPLGYSLTTGAACSGVSVAIPYLAGCTSIYGFSTISGVACNGTNVVQSTTVITTPYLPTTGAGSDALVNLFLLLSSAVVAIIGGFYLVRRYTKTV